MLPGVTADRARRWRIIFMIAVTTILLKVLATILWEYRFYFPPDFESAFLSGRRGSFAGLYRWAFYVHILTGPAVLLLGGWLMFSGPRFRLSKRHRMGGRIQGSLVLMLLVPTGLIMASQAYAGPIAGAGFASLSLATGVFMVLAVIQARRGDVSAHRRWATRCYLLLCSPLLLRIVTGATVLLEKESDVTYQLNAWVSWLVPLGLYESWLLFCRLGRETSDRRRTIHKAFE